MNKKQLIALLVTIVFVGFVNILFTNNTNKVNVNNIENLSKRFDTLENQVKKIDSLSNSIMMSTDEYRNSLKSVNSRVSKLTSNRVNSQNAFSTGLDSLNNLMKSYHVELNKLSKSLEGKDIQIKIIK